MLFDFSTVLIFLLFSVGFVLAQLVLSRIVAPRAPSAEKSMPYECGEVPEGTPWIRFNPRYYVIALVFLVFDVEIALMYPAATTFKNWVDAGLGKPALYEILAFVGVLLVGLAYVWKKGYLEWIRVFNVSEEEKNLTKSRVA
jgi:NADH-quinone oxidoreductase subunit A